MNQKGFSFIMTIVGLGLLTVTGAVLWFYLSTTPPLSEEITQNEIISEKQPEPVASPMTDYSLIQQKYNLDDKQIETLSQVDSTRL